MLSLRAQKREILGKKVRNLRKEGYLPAVLYGPQIKNLSLKVDGKEFEKVYQEAGESALISLKVDKKDYKVLIHDVQKDPLSGAFLHIDFYQPSLTEKTEVKVPLVFEGEAPAVKELGGTLVKNILEIEVRALPQDLPHELKVNLQGLKTFEDHIAVKDLPKPKGVEILREPEEVIAQVLPPEKVEEELEKPVEEEPEKVEKVGEEKEKEKEKEKETKKSQKEQGGGVEKAK